jgi:DNA repair protein RecN (Recombination protein N)
MLAELCIQDFAIIDRLCIEFSPGLNILTGETGAGKSIIIDAVSAILGERAHQEWLRSGSSSLLVEGVFVLPEAAVARLLPLLEREGLEGDRRDVLMLSREIRSTGRNIARVNGRATSLAVLREIGDALVDIHGQGEHLSLLKRSQHFLLLDRFAGLEELRQKFAEGVARLRQVRSELKEIRTAERDRVQRLDLLNYQVNEIESARLEPGELEELQSERTRLAHAAQLLELMDAAYRLLELGEEQVPGASDLVGQASGFLAKAAAIDPSLEEMQVGLDSVAEQLGELIGELQEYRDSLEFNPRRLDEVEERLALLENLQRKYGDTIEEILAYADKAREEIEKLSHSEELSKELEEEENRLLHHLGDLGMELSNARRIAASELAEAVERELQDLNMRGARFSVAIEQKESPDGVFVGDRRLAFDATGIDRVEFLVSANPGEELRPIVKVASGGETARLMLALKVVLTKADPTPVLIFDEIDVGIGGRVGSVVGRKLRQLAESHQVLCITHLPQVAAYGERHLKVTKKVVEGRTVTEASPLQGEGRLEELAAMLGTPGESGLRSAEELLAGAERE